MFKVINFCTKMEGFIDDIVVRKVLIDTYNCCLAFMIFKEKKGLHKKWIFAPLCVQDNLNDYAKF